MARRKKGNPIHGWLALDKPLGLTSTQALSRIKRMLGADKAGHAGTLDPLATGVLPIAFGEATKTVPFAVDGEKSYLFTVRWGAQTTTDDAEGDVVDVSDARPSRADVVGLLPSFIGEISQVPPNFSAIKVDGRRAYDLSRDGVPVVLEARTVVIDDLRLIEMPDADTAVFQADCGKGTYVRSVARDMGRALGCYGHVVALRRTRVGPFDENAMVSMASLDDAVERGGLAALMQFLAPVETVLDDVPSLDVSLSDAATLARGQSILIRGRDAPVMSGLAYAMSKGRLIALGEIEKGALHPTRVFNLT